MNNGEKPAYPDPMRGADQSYGNQCPESLPTGLTKREMLASMAMQGILSNSSFSDMKTKSSITAQFALNHAGALLKALETNNEQ